MDLVSTEKAAEAEARALVAQPSWTSSEFLLVAAGGVAMLLVVGIFDALKLLS
jgi:hypothetical protein